MDWTPPSGLIRLEEYEALKFFFAATHGKLWNRRDRWGVGDPCEPGNQWYGLACFNPCVPGIDGERCQLARLQSLALPANNLYGTIPPSAFTALKNLTVVDLSYNELDAKAGKALAESLAVNSVLTYPVEKSDRI